MDQASLWQQCRDVRSVKCVTPRTLDITLMKSYECISLTCLIIRGSSRALCVCVCVCAQAATPTRKIASMPAPAAPTPKRVDGVCVEEAGDLEELEQFAKNFKQRRIKLGFTQVCE